MSDVELDNRALPVGLKPFFQEYDFQSLETTRHANLIIPRVLENGDWEELRWLFGVYGARRIRLYLRRYGERSLQPVTFNYWRKLLKIRRWRSSPLRIPKGELWKP
jgi:hypothetical protein